MKPVWIVDDDRSIRWVLEKALAREQIAHKSFASAVDALAGHYDNEAKQQATPIEWKLELPRQLPLPDVRNTTR